MQINKIRIAIARNINAANRSRKQRSKIVMNCGSTSWEFKLSDSLEPDLQILSLVSATFEISLLTPRLWLYLNQCLNIKYKKTNANAGNYKSKVHKLCQAVIDICLGKSGSRRTVSRSASCRCIPSHLSHD